jgi:hypothetical protein
VLTPARGRLGALLAVVVTTVGLVLSGAAGSAPTKDAASTKDEGAGRRSYSSRRYGFSLSLPPGWQRAQARLVPKLLSPLEILSVGTFPMPVGGGGNCGRYPIAAIERMQSGDALVSVQEYATNPKMRARAGTDSPPPPLARLKAKLRQHPDQIGLRKELHARGGEWAPPARAYWSATLSFTSHTRWFDAILYVRGHPTAARLNQLASTLAHLRFDPGPRVGLPST